MEVRILHTWSSLSDRSPVTLCTQSLRPQSPSLPIKFSVLKPAPLQYPQLKKGGRRKPRKLGTKPKTTQFARVLTAWQACLGQGTDIYPIISQAFGGVPVQLRTQSKCSARVSHNSSGKENRREIKGGSCDQSVCKSRTYFSYSVSGALVGLLCPLPLHPLQTHAS